MPAGVWNPTMGMRGVLLCVLLSLLLWPEPGSASLPLTMESVVRALASLEEASPTVPAGHPTFYGGVLWPQDPMFSFLHKDRGLGAPKTEAPRLSPELEQLLKEVARSRVQGQRELGVVLAPDGSTVAVQPLMTGLVAGLLGRREVTLPGEVTASPPDAGVPPNATAPPPSTVDSLVAATLAGELGLAFLRAPQTRSPPGLGVDGCWDQLSHPRNFSLSEPRAGRLTLAFLNGAVDGLILGAHLSHAPEPRPALSHLLTEYYGNGVSGDPQLHSSHRRQRTARLLPPAPSLARQVWGTLLVLRGLQPRHPEITGTSQERLAAAASQAAEEFMEAFLGCPAIHPPCRWGARPARGPPSPLHLPLGQLFVHHTYIPAPPCTRFPRCAADMRTMQRYHQDTQGWDDIGYSFVVGSDGYVYEGRGWHRVGAHTRGHNARGFGVAIVGNFTAALPDPEALRTVRQWLPGCAVRAGLLRPDYGLRGHRQLVSTPCPGDALFRLLTTWPHFRPS